MWSTSKVNPINIHGIRLEYINLSIALYLQLTQYLMFHSSPYTVITDISKAHQDLHCKAL